jgi:predicted TIM-barrel fold metal-dependent hydrolase
MILDAHTHLFPEEVQKDRSAFCSRDESFRQLYGAEKARMASLKELLQSMDREGVDGSVVCGFPWSDPGLCREGNDYLLHCAQRTPHRIIPFATVSLGSLRRAEKELERCLSRGAKGIGELAFYRGGITPRDVLRLSSWAQTLADTGVPLLLHVNEPVGHDYPGKSLKTLQPIYQFLQRVPDVNVILAHWGGGFFFYELGGLSFSLPATGLLDGRSNHRARSDPLGKRFPPSLPLPLFSGTRRGGAFFPGPGEDSGRQCEAASGPA